MQQIHFAELELTNTAPYANQDLIYYRGHLGKLKKDIQLQVLKNLHASLSPKGYLVIGSGDHIGSEVAFFSPVDRNGIVYKPVHKARKVNEPTVTVNLFRKDGKPSEASQEDKKVAAGPAIQKIEELNPHSQIAELHRDLLLQRQNPVSIIVNADFSIIDQYGQVNLYMAWPNNGKTANLLEAFPEEVRNDLQEAVKQAIKQQKALKSKTITTKSAGVLQPFLLHVRPLDLPESKEPVVQVMFISPDQNPGEVGLAPSLKGQPLNSIVNKLEADLRHSKDRLNLLTGQLEEAKKKQGANNSSPLQPKVVEKLQQQNTELKTTNKELLALNRDLVRRIEELRKRTHQAEAEQVLTPAPVADPASDGKISAFLSKQILMLTTNRHEIRTALTSIMGFADLLADRVYDADNKELARYISKAGNRLSDSLSDLLEGDFEEFEVFEQPQVEEPVVEDSTLSDRLLVVEDSDATRRLLSLVLSDRFECELAADASEAIEKAQKERFKAVLMDINLGTGKSGVEVLEHLRQTSPYQQVPFMAVTAMASPRDESLLLNKGFDAYLAKPFQKSKLLSTLDQMLSTSRAA